MRITHKRKKLGSTSAMAIVEMVLASAVGVLVLGALLTLVMEVAKEQRRGMVDSSLETEANLLEDKLNRLLRSMSSAESVLTSDPIATGSVFFRKIIIARGQTPTYPREEIAYDSTLCKLVHDPTRSASGDEVTLMQGTNSIVLRNCYFFLGTKVDGSLDSSAVSVFLQFDDNCNAMRRNADRSLRRTQATRVFTVKMRNN